MKNRGIGGRSKLAILSLLLVTLSLGCSSLEKYEVPPRSTSEPAPEDYAFYSSLYRDSTSLQPGELLAIADKAIATSAQAYAHCFSPRNSEERGFETQALASTGKDAKWKPQFSFGRPYKLLGADDVRQAENCIRIGNGQKDSSCNAYQGIRYVRFLSLPIFNRDHNRALVLISRVCGGLCGQGSMQAYRKEKGVFKLEPIPLFTACGFIESQAQILL